MRGRPFKKGISGNPGGRPKVVAELHALARTHAPDAIEELARLAVKARSEPARVAAIRELLDRGYGKATQFLAGEDEADRATAIRVVFVKPKPQPNEGDLGPVGPKLR